MRMIKKTSMILLIAMVAFAYTPVMNMAESSKAAAKPAKIKSVKAVYKGSVSITLKWKKAKNAKKYQVVFKKGKKLIPVIRTIKTKYEIKNLKPGKTYTFMVRGINGKKKGDFSKPLTVRTAKKGRFHSTPIPTNKIDPKKIKTGDTYVMQSDSGEKVKVTITYVDYGKWGTDVRGTIEDGGEYIYNYSTSIGTENIDICNDLDFKYFEQDWTYDSKMLSDTMRVKIKDNDTVMYWTLDGTEPKIGQKDKFGTSDMVMFMKSLSEQIPVHRKTQLIGTVTKKGTTLINTGNDTVNKNRCCWYKVYRKGKLLNEFKQTVHDPS